MTSKAVFFDKDGILVEELPYNIDPHQMQLVEGALESLRFLQEQGYRLIVVTNQSGVARGLFEEQALHQVRHRLREMLQAAGVFLTGFYYCPHHPQGKVSKYTVECFCRKPQPGMLYRAALEHGIRLADSWLVSDLLPDIEAGNRAGCKTVLIDDSYQAGWRFAPIRQPKFTVKNLESAARAIAWGSLTGTEAGLWSEKQPSSRNRLTLLP